MKAVVIARYGGPEVLEMKELDKPKLAAGQLLVKVKATAVNPIDWKIRSGSMKLFVRKELPFILGCDIAGEVAEVSAGSKFAVGDAVLAAMPGDTGAYAEYVAIAEDFVAKKPKNMSFEEAASMPAAAATALQALRDMGTVRAGQRVIVNGASGGVGLFAVQIGKALGAHVTGVCSGDNVALVRGLGADQVLDYKTDNIFQAAGEPFDMVFDLISNHDFGKWQKIMKPRSVYVAANPKNWGAAFGRQTFLNPFTSKKAFVIILKHTSESMRYLAELAEQGKLKAVVDRVFPLSEVAAAHKYSETGRAKGKIVLTM